MDLHLSKLWHLTRYWADWDKLEERSEPELIWNMVSLLRTKHSDTKITLWFLMSALKLSGWPRALVEWEKLRFTFTKHFQNRLIHIKFHLDINSTVFSVIQYIPLHTPRSHSLTHSPTSSSSNAVTLYLNKTFLCLLSSAHLSLLQVFIQHNDTVGLLHTFWHSW